jgi:uncharacterized 2Fe-2S/4Fe-4S cluster protein (DUF4445 family)
MPHQIDIQPIGRRMEVAHGANLLDACQQAGIELVAVCGGAGVCATCRVRLVSGTLSELMDSEREDFSPEELAQGIRKACQAEVLSDIVVEIPPESLSAPQRLSIEGLEEEFTWSEPVVRAIEVEVPPASLEDLRPDTTRVIQDVRRRNKILAERRIRFDPEAAKQLAPALRNNREAWHVRLALRGDEEVVAVFPVNTKLFGLAVDVGTTKLAAYLIELEKGEIVAKSGAMNPQIGYGEDIISRIRYINDHTDGLKTLQSRLIEAVNGLLEELCKEAKVKQEQVVEAVLVGNTAMHHILAGLPVKQLGDAPYMATVGESLEIKARDLGLNLAPGATIYLPPNITGFVGADHVAMLIGASLPGTEKTVVALDIGTNTEISAYRGGRHWTTSCPSGPAFEGAHIEDGMRAAPGAVERVLIDGDNVDIHTINNMDAVGICGSGILDAIAQLTKAGLLLPKGAFTGTHPRLRGTGSKAEFVLVPAAKSKTGRDIRVTRRDVNEIQLAKSAIRTGTEVLMDRAGIKLEDIDQFVIAGAFGTYLDVDSAVTIGMFPRIDRARYHQIGNAAGTGARRMLVSMEARKLADKIVRDVNYVELAKHETFSKIFSKALMLE